MAKPQLTATTRQAPVPIDKAEPARPTGDPNDARLLTFGLYGVTLEPAP